MGSEPPCAYSVIVPWSPSGIHTSLDCDPLSSATATRTATRLFDRQSLRFFNGALVLKWGLESSHVER
jgi:hypothetical protein